MDAAYTVADVIISRAGALSISELCLVGKPTVLVPSPNVSEDHQTKNAVSLKTHHAALLVPDIEAKEFAMQTVFGLLKDERKMEVMSNAIKKMAKPNASADIVDVIEGLVKKK